MDSAILTNEAFKLPARGRAQIIGALWRSLDPAEQSSIDHWVSEGLGIGHYTRVMQAVRRLSRRPGRKLEKIKRKLVAIEAAQQPNACE